MCGVRQNKCKVAKFRGEIMDNERRAKLQETMKKFNKKHKTEVFTMGSEIESLQAISTGIEKVDDFLGGGFKKSAHTIVWGNFSVGKTALIMTTIAKAQRDGQICCYVNTEKPIEPERFQYFGINLDELVYIEAPANAEQALEAMRTLCKEQVIDMFIVDSTNGLCPKSVQETAKGAERSLEKKNVASLALTLSNFYNAVNALVFKSKAGVVWIGQARTQGIGGFFVHLGLSGGQAQQFYAFQIINMRRGQKADSPIEKTKEYFCDPDGKIRFQTKDNAVGFSVVMKMEKTNSSKSAKEHQTLEIPFYHETGFHPLPEREIAIKIRDGESEESIAKIKALWLEKGINVEKTSETLDKTDDDMLNLNKEDKKAKKKKGK